MYKIHYVTCLGRRERNIMNKTKNFHVDAMNITWCFISLFFNFSSIHLTFQVYINININIYTIYMYIYAYVYLLSKYSIHYFGYKSYFKVTRKQLFKIQSKQNNDQFCFLKLNNLVFVNNPKQGNRVLKIVSWGNCK